jgi:Ca-activated chloride channel homolog
VIIANASTKQRWFEDVIAAFETKGIVTASGRTIKIESQPVLSGGSLQDLLDGKLKPTVWSPGSASWVEEFSSAWTGLGQGGSNERTLPSDGL